MYGYAINIEDVDTYLRSTVPSNGGVNTYTSFRVIPKSITFDDKPDFIGTCPIYYDKSKVGILIDANIYKEDIEKSLSIAYSIKGV